MIGSRNYLLELFEKNPLKQIQSLANRDTNKLDRLQKITNSTSYFDVKNLSSKQQKLVFPFEARIRQLELQPIPTNININFRMSRLVANESQLICCKKKMIQGSGWVSYVCGLGLDRAWPRFNLSQTVGPGLN